jgi:hypothetical protein
MITPTYDSLKQVPICYEELKGPKNLWSKVWKKFQS